MANNLEMITSVEDADLSTSISVTQLSTELL